MKSLSNSPGQVLLNTFLKPKGVSAQEFSEMSGIHPKRLHNIIVHGRMTYDEINRISTVTRTAPRYWHYLQVAWLYDRYLKSRKEVKPIEPVSLPWQSYSESPGQILCREFIKPCGKSFRSIEQKYKIRYPSLHNVVYGKTDITPLLAAQLHVAFGTSTRYWLDLQTCQEIEKILDTSFQDNKLMKADLQEFQNCLELRKFNNEKENKRPVHPGKILINEFIKPSGIGIIEWGKILFILTKELKLILSGRRRLSVKMIIKLSLAFKTGILFWIDLNNKYYAWLADVQCGKLLRKVVREPAGLDSRPLGPLEFLESNFLRPMDFPMKQFLRHVGLKSNYGRDIRVMIPRISFELA